MHFPGYYQGTSRTRSNVPAEEQWPDDSEPPIPIKLLLLPVGSSFPFKVVNGSRSGDPTELTDSFEAFATDVIDHAFAELSFGAKGSAGYGWLAGDREAEVAEQAARIAVLTEDLSPFEAVQARLRHTLDPQQVHDVLNNELHPFEPAEKRLLAMEIQAACKRLGLLDEPGRRERRLIKKLNKLFDESGV